MPLHPLPQGTLSCATPQGAFSAASGIHLGAIHLAGGKTVQIGYPANLSCPQLFYRYARARYKAEGRSLQPDDKITFPTALAGAMRR
jgi:hypothetical protein